MTTTGQTKSATRTPNLPARLAIAAGVALVLNLIIEGLGTVTGAGWTVEGGLQIGIALVIVASLVPIIFAGAILAALIRRWPRLQLWAAWIGLAFGVLSAPMSLMTAKDAATAISLACMHVITALAWFFATRPARH